MILRGEYMRLNPFGGVHSLDSLHTVHSDGSLVVYAAIAAQESRHLLTSDQAFFPNLSQRIAFQDSMHVHSAQQVSLIGASVITAQNAAHGHSSGQSTVTAHDATPDANTLFLARFQVSPPINEVDNAVGTLVGGATCDTANSQLVCDGVGDWATWAGGSNFDVTANWTTEFHTDQAAGEAGGTSSRSSGGDSRYSFFFDSTGGIRFFVDRYSASIAMLTSSGAVLDGTEHHVAVCRDGGTWRMYVDGVQVASRVESTAPTNSTDTFFVGADALVPSARDILGRFGRVKNSNVCRYPGGTTFSPPSRTSL